MKRIQDAARDARDGDVVEIEAGTYVDEVASWPQNDITIRGVGGVARMISTGSTAEAKAIWVIKGDNVVVQNIAFSGARTAFRNGAGIRHEGGKLAVRECLFEHNEMGILTWNSLSAELSVEGSEFRENHVDERYSQSDPGHQIYVGRIGLFTLSSTYIHHGAVGHLVKSRAREHRIWYNRLTDEATGRASYELEFPDGGIAYVIGNIVQQSARTENRTMVSFGAERYYWPQNELYLVSNTLVDDLPVGGQFLSVARGATRVQAFNNLLVGRGALGVPSSGSDGGNFTVRAAQLAAANQFDYRLISTAPPFGLAVDPGEANGMRLSPKYEYVHPMKLLPIRRGRLSPGALQTTAR
jgi:hypothetical protein